MTTTTFTAHAPVHSEPLTQRIRVAVSRWIEQQRRAAEDHQYWQAALNDPRLMADIRCAMGRAESGRR